MCNVWDRVMGSPFLRFSCTISNPVSMQELGIVVNSYVDVYICRHGLHTMHAYALQFGFLSTSTLASGPITLMGWWMYT